MSSRSMKLRARDLSRSACAAGLALALAAAPLAGCASTTAGTSSDAAASATASSSSLPESSASIEHLLVAGELVSDADLDPAFDDASAVHVTLQGSTASSDGAGVEVSGGAVTITKGGTYVLAGELDDGQVVVDANGEKVQLVLAGASVTCVESAALYVRDAKKVFLTLADGTQNALSTSGEFAASDEANIDGAIFAKADLTVNGAGGLSVSCASGHGIVCKDDLVLVSGTVDVTAGGHAIQAKDSAVLVGGDWALSAGTDGLHCGSDDDASGEKGYVLFAGGTWSIEAESDGVDAAGVLEVDGGEVSVSAGDDGLHSERALQVDGGSIAVAKSYEGLEGSTVTINAGQVDVVSSDDGINAAGDPGDGSGDGSADALGAAEFDAPGGLSGESTAGQAPTQPDEGQDMGAASNDALASGAGQAPGDAQAPDTPQARGSGQALGGMDDNDPTAQIAINGGTIHIQAGGDGVDSNGDLTVNGGELYVSGPTSDGDGSLDFGGTGTVTGGIVMCAGSAGMLQTFGADVSTQPTIAVSASGSAGDLVQVADASGNVLASFTPTTAYACVLVSAPGLEVGQTYTVTCGGVSQEVTLDSMVFSNVTGGTGGMGVMGGSGAGGQGGPDASRQGDPGAAGQGASGGSGQGSGSRA